MVDRFELQQGGPYLSRDEANRAALTVDGGRVKPRRRTP